MEQYSRGGNVVSGTWVVFHPPGVYAHDYSITLGPDGVPVRYAMQHTTPGPAAKPDFDSVLIDCGRDTAAYTLAYRDSTVRRRIRMRDAFPTLGQSWVGLELALGRLRRAGRHFRRPGHECGDAAVARRNAVAGQIPAW